MDKMIAYCGLICTDCSSYIATQKNDLEAKEAEVVKWREMFNKASSDIEIDTDFVTCDGCLAFEVKLSGHCSVCDVRNCGIEKKVENCGYCKEYPCPKIEKLFDDFSKVLNIEDFFGYSYNPRDVLNEIHNSNNVN